MTIREATTRDIPAMTRLLGELFSIEKDFQIEPEKQQRGLELLLEAPAAKILVAEKAIQDNSGREHSHVIGMVTGQLVISTAQGAPSLLVEDLVVTQSARGEATGSHLLQAIMNWANSRGAQRMQLLADQTNQPALNFYAQRGWSTTRMICLRCFQQG